MLLSLFVFMKFIFIRKTFVAKFRIRNWSTKSQKSSDKSIIVQYMPNRIAEFSVLKIVSCRVLYDFNSNMALTLGLSVLNAIDSLGKDDMDIFVLMAWSAASSTSRGILHSSARSKISVTDMDWDCSAVDREHSFSCIK